MKKLCLLVVTICMILTFFSGCDDSYDLEEETVPPTEITLNSDQFGGMTRYDVYNLLTDNGFTNVIPSPLDDLTSDDCSTADVVEYVTINGGKEYKIGDKFMSDSTIRIFYHNVKKNFLPFSSDERDDSLLYEDIKKQFEEKGFVNVVGEPIEDLILGFLTQDGEIEEIIVDGKKEFKSYDYVAFDAKIVIRYHTFPSNDEDTMENGGNDTTNNDNPSKDEILTADNNADLARLLAIKDESDPFIQEFANKYRGRTIEFDGNVTAMANHDDYNTRYDILLGCGDYDANSQQGPNFKFKNVNASDLDLDTLFMEEVIRVGVNVHVVAVVGDYNYNNTLFELKPISVTTR